MARLKKPSNFNGLRASQSDFGNFHYRISVKHEKFTEIFPVFCGKCAKSRDRGGRNAAAPMP
jgi:hypothetical protein